MLHVIDITHNNLPFSDYFIGIQIHDFDFDINNGIERLSLGQKL